MSFATNSAIAPAAPIAIVGIGCRLPGGVVDPASFWQLLVEGRQVIGEVPPDRWSLAAYFHPDRAAAGAMASRWGGFLNTLKEFDAGFWGVSPREAQRMDPQQRWLLEVAWEAIEDAGTAPSRLRGAPIGVFIGISGNDYGSLQLGDAEQVDAYTNSGNTASIASNRISYMLDLRGPSVSLDTACSSSLVAVAMACDSLRTGACETALAGGVNALITPQVSVGFSKASMLSPSGRCYAFDARADGYVRAEGVGVVVLKPLDRALANRDRIYAVIRGTAVNQDGHTSSMTVPSVDGQSAMLAAAYANAGVVPASVAYVETHGTGTPLGDPIEATALGRVLGAGRAPDEACVIGSVKANIGHLESASGIAGLIKAALVAQHRLIPPSLNYERPNPQIPFESLRLVVANRARPLASPNDEPPIVGVNSFGFGGTNAHVVLQSPPQAQESAPAVDRADRPLVLPISARDETALRAYVSAFCRCLQNGTEPLADLCAAAGSRKEQHTHRLVVAGRTGSELEGQLRQWLRDGHAPGVVSGRTKSNRSPVFVFTGQGGQWWAMGRTLAAREPLVRRRLEETDRILRAFTGSSLIDELNRDEVSSQIDGTDIAQPALFALQVALVDLWRSWGITPAAVIGHSVGEVAAAFTAGIYSFDDAVRLIYHRSRLQHTTHGQGRMTVVAVSPERAATLVREVDGVEIAAINSPQLITLCGDAAGLETIERRLTAEGVFFRWLRIPYAFHSRTMDPVRDELLDVLADLAPQPAILPFVSTVDGDIRAGQSLDASYWWDNVRRPVLFADGIDALARDGHNTFLEIGPHPTLEGAITHCLAARGITGAAFHSLRRDADDSVEVVQTLAAMHTHGIAVDWQSFNQANPTSAALPRYPWTHEPFWFESPASAARRLDGPDHPLLGRRLDTPSPTWQLTLDLRRLPYLADHQIWDRVVLPGAAFVEMALAVAARLFPDDRHAVEDLAITAPLFLTNDTPATVRVAFDPADKSLQIHGSPDGTATWELHASCTLVRTSADSGSDPAAAASAADRLRRCGRHYSHDEYRTNWARCGYQFGPNFQLVEHLWRGRNETLIEIAVPEALAADHGRYHFHPAVLDACSHAFLGLQMVDDNDAAGHLYLPERIGRVVVYETPVRQTRLVAWARLLQDDRTSLVADIHVWGTNGELVADLRQFALARVEQRLDDRFDDHFYRFEWEPCHLRDASADGTGALPAGVDEQEAARSDEAAPSPRQYLVFADRGDLAESLAAALHLRGHDCRMIAADATLSAPEVRQALDEAPRISGVIHCRSLDHPPAEAVDLTALRAAQDHGLMSAMEVIQAVADRSVPVWFVTRGVFRAQPQDLVSGLASAPLVGLTRVANNEHECRFFVIDLDQAAAETDVGHLLGEVTLPSDGEFEVAYRGGRRHVPRLRRVRSDTLVARTYPAVARDGGVRPFRLESRKPGVLTNLAWHETRRADPEPGAIEVRVHAGGINFRDVMKALGTYPGRPQDVEWFGDDFAGVVSRVGAGVNRWQPGDRVAGMAPYAFRSFATTDARFVFGLPASMPFEDAATIPTVFLTAHHALTDLARLQPGERVLIHAGAGGVGLAAIQVAQQLSLEIFATAGTAEKRALLRSLGVPHVMSSRTLAFADEIMTATDGRGVDAVLNSLAGDFIPRSLSVLAPFGRFIEIGKVDLHRNAKIGLQTLRQNISYHVLDLTQYLREKPALVERLLGDVSARFASGAYRPLQHTTFPAADVIDAFRHMAQGKHVGKNVLTIEPPRMAVAFPSPSAHRFRPDGTYLVTGGAGGIGLRVAQWIADCGGRHLVLMSRSGPDDESRAIVDGLRARGASVVDARGDVADATAVARVIDDIAISGQPLRGVFHAATVFDDEFIARQSRDRFNRVLEPKMAGAWNLHAATRALALDHFVCFSSFSTVIALPKQASYDAGNLFLDQLAHHRHALGLPALTVNFGAVLGAGIVERQSRDSDWLTRLGVGAMQIDETLRVLERLMPTDAAQVSAARIDWDQILRLSPFVATSAAYQPVRHAARDGAGRGSLRTRLHAATGDERVRLTHDFVVSQVAAVFGIADERIDPATPLTNLGLDSLMILELTNRVERELGLRLPMASLLGGPNIVELSATVLRLLAPSLADGSNAAGHAQDASATAVDEAAPAADHLVLLQRGDRRAPIVAFHPAGGGVQVYSGLARQLPNTLLYGVESRLKRGAVREYDSLDVMVERYVSAVRAVGGGPYRLVGFSLGGYLAARVAEALEAEGDEVHGVGVIDWDIRPRATLEGRRDRLIDMSVAAYRFAQEAGLVRPLPHSTVRSQVTPIVDAILGGHDGGGDLFFQWLQSQQLVMSPALEEIARQQLTCFEQHCQLLREPLPAPQPRAPLCVWRARHGFGSDLASWQRAGELDCEYIYEGDHIGWTQPGTIEPMAQQLADFFARAAVTRDAVAPGAPR